MAAASRCPLMGMSASMVFVAKFNLGSLTLYCIRVSFSLAITVLSAKLFWLECLFLLGLVSRVRCLVPLKILSVLRPSWDVSGSLGSVDVPCWAVSIRG